MSLPLLLGHRGARATRTVPENTLQSFDLALTHGCDGFEFDVRLTADGRAVICHDGTVEGCEIAQAGATDLKHLPQLVSVLDRYAQQAFLDIEIKVPGLEKSVMSALKLYPPQRGYVVSSFLPEVLQALRELDPDIPLGLICEDSAQLAPWKSLPVEYVIPHHTLIDQGLVRSLHGDGKKIVVWTVNRREAMRHFREIDVDGIVSDDTRLLVETLRRGSQKLTAKS
jgi:glycerophosphoryl diester phosphodiesterase